MKLSKNYLRVLFINYSYVIHFFHLILNICPPIVRKILFKLTLNKMGSNVFIDSKVYFRYPNRVKIGSNVSINRGCEFYPSLYFKNAIIKIGNNVRFGPNVLCLAAGHDYRYLDLPDTAGKIEIHDNTWIGGNVTILPGVTINEGCIIGAGSVVTRDTKPYGIYFGVPAKFNKKRSLDG